MILEAMCMSEVLSKWPGRNGKPAGEGYDAFLIDRSQPQEHRLRKMYAYRLTDEERVKYAGKLADQPLRVAVHEIFMNERGALLRGAIVSVGMNGK